MHAGPTMGMDSEARWQRLFTQRGLARKPPASAGLGKTATLKLTPTQSTGPSRDFTVRNSAQEEAYCHSKQRRIPPSMVSRVGRHVKEKASRLFVQERMHHLTLSNDTGTWQSHLVIGFRV